MFDGWSRPTDSNSVVESRPGRRDARPVEAGNIDSPGGAGEQERWQLAGNAADVYQEYLVPAIFGPWAPVVVEAAGLRLGERVLDLACGTGVVARQAAPSVGADGTVVGVDNNPAMLAVARSVRVASGPPIEWREADAMALPFADAAFDVVCCQLGLQYFPDRSAVLRQMRRVLVPGGRVVLLVWQSIEHSPGFAVFAEALDRHVGTPAGSIMRAPFVLGDADEFRAVITGAGFRDVSVRAAVGTVRFPSAERFVEYQVAGSPLGAPVAEAGAPARDALVEAVKAAMAPYKSGDGVAFPIGARLANGIA
jgi:ubiquinone/menaquinone biosynthesis C-methylase UbiE